MISGIAAKGADLSDQITVFVITVGDEQNFQDSLEHIKRQTVHFRFEVISRIAPMSAAFQEMINRCRTPFFVQVDEDMLLFPTAIESLYKLMAAGSPATAMVCGPLWDCDVGNSIYGVKIYRHSILRQFPYEDNFSCERTQLRRIRKAGYDVRLMPLEGRSSCFGEHGKHYTPRTAFVRYRRLMQKRRRYGAHCARGIPGPDYLLARYLETGNISHLFALLGAVVGIASDLPPDRELDFRDPLPDFERLTRFFPPFEAESSGNPIRDRKAV